MVYKENITIQLEAMGFCVINDDQPIRDCTPHFNTSEASKYTLGLIDFPL
jgi:hypothetical protein